MKKIEVEFRCCCRPDKLLGSIRIPESYLQLPRISFRLVPERIEDTGEVLTLPVADVRLERGATPYKAIKAEGVDIGTLRRIPGFKSAHGVVYGGSAET